MKLSQFLELYEAKKKVGAPAEQGKNLTNIELKKDKDPGFIKPGDTKKKEKRSSLANFQQMGKWNYVKGMMMNLAIPYLEHKWCATGAIDVMLDADWCDEAGYKSDKDGKLEKKFYEMLEDAGFQTETITFFTKQIPQREVERVVTA